MRKGLITVVVLAVLALWSCRGPGEAQPPAPVPVDPPAAATGAADPTPPAMTTPPAESDHVAPPPGADPEWVPETTAPARSVLRRAERQAESFMQAYARPPAGLATLAWWDTVRPYLTAAGAQKLKRAPQQVPFRKVTAPADAAQGEGTSLVATVTTDAGQWMVTFTQTPDEQLLVEDLTPRRSPSSTSSTDRPRGAR